MSEQILFTVAGGGERKQGKGKAPALVSGKFRGGHAGGPEAQESLTTARVLEVCSRVPVPRELGQGGEAGALQNLDGGKHWRVLV